MKSRGVYETPGGTILYRAHEILETLCLDRDTQHYKYLVAQQFAELVYFGKWFTPLREALSAFVDKTQETVTGDELKRLRVSAIAGIGNAINAAIKEGMKSETTDGAEADDEVFDVYLNEIEQKN